MKKSNFGIFFKKPPDDYLFESMIIFCIFFWAIPIFYFPRDIKFDLTSVPAQCDQLIHLICIFADISGLTIHGWKTFARKSNVNYHNEQQIDIWLKFEDAIFNFIKDTFGDDDLDVWKIWMC